LPASARLLAMSSTLLEQARLSHQELEQGVGRVVKLLAHETKTHKQKLIQQHKVLKHVQGLQKTASKLVTHYEDKDEAVAAEKETMGGSEIFGSFYGRLKDLRDYHRKFPNLYHESEVDRFVASLDDDAEIMSQFTGEEFAGRFLDLNPLHMKFINLKGTKAVTYEAYLAIFSDFSGVPKEVRTKKYLEYVQELRDYLVSFIKRTQPLQDVDKLVKECEEEYEEKCEEDAGDGDDEMDNDFERGIDLEGVSGWEELRDMGLEPLKAELTKLGLKCGGSLEQRAKRLFDTKGKLGLYEVDPSMVQGAGGGSKAKTADLDKLKANKRALLKEVGLAEFEVAELAAVLKDAVKATQDQLQKKQSRTHEELQAEVENEVGDDEPESESEDDEEEKPIYNPKKVPLDWTGKPIPYWLYKLHGLNVEYSCEICGNVSYWGPRAFERHFQEWRHAHGMRCLKVPNTRAFHNITKIQDALDLFERLKTDQTTKDFDREAEEEYEDGAGNVLSKKTYQDLLRQGLL